AVAEVDAHDAELHDPAAAFQSQQDLAGVMVAVLPRGEHAHVDQVAVVPFDGDGHVVLVDEEAVVGRRDLVGGDDVVLGHVVGGREQGVQRSQVRADGPGGRVHVVSWIRGGFSGSGVGAWRSRTVSTRKYSNSRSSAGSASSATASARARNFSTSFSALEKTWAFVNSRRTRSIFSRPTDCNPWVCLV